MYPSSNVMYCVFKFNCASKTSLHTISKTSLLNATSGYPTGNITRLSTSFGLICANFLGEPGFLGGSAVELKII